MQLHIMVKELALNSLGRYTEAIESYDKALEINPELVLEINPEACQCIF